MKPWGMKDRQLLLPPSSRPALTRGMENSPQRLTMQGVMEVEDKAEAAVVTELLDMVKSPFLKVVISSDTL